ncbi:MAG TPA: hypothetical protein VMY17_01595 [Thermoplasmata archaeon]|nr:hypothetical protein [Thermoplasmata archaeon]
MAGIDAPTRIARAATPEVMAAFGEGVIKGDWQQRPYEFADHHLKWFKHLQDSDRLLVLAARGHAKTETLVVLPILYLTCNCKDLLIYIVSVTQEQANKILGRVVAIIEREYPALKDRRLWGKTEIRTTTNINIVAKGVTTSVIGPHPQYIFVDDPIDAMQTHKDSVIEEWFFADLYPMLSTQGRMLIVGTYKHYGDLYHAIQAKNLFDTHIYPAENEDGSRLWPEEWTDNALADRKAALGSLLYAREYMLQPIDDSSSMFPMTLLSEAFDPELPLQKWSDGEEEGYVGVDPAASASIGADYSVFTVLGYDRENDHITILNPIRDRGMTMRAHLAQLQPIEDAYHPVHLKIEKNAFQRWLEQEAKGLLKKLPITGHNTGKEKSDMREGVPSLRLLFERGDITIPRGPTQAEREAGTPAAEWESVVKTEPLIHELNSLSFEGDKIKTVAKHDDMVMSLWLAVMAVREGKKQRGIGVATVDTTPPRTGSRAKKASQIARRGFRR